jgi:hypothetical protein
MVTSPQVSWLFFKAVRAGLAVKRPYLSHTGRASDAEKQPTGRGPEGCVENGPAAALLVGYVSIKICALLAPCRWPILNATTSPLYARRYTTTTGLLLGLRNLLCAGGDVLLLVCGFRLFLFLRRVLVRGFRRFVTHDPKIKVLHKRRQPARRNASSCGNCPRDTDSA